MTWLDARDRCRETDGGDLASFSGQDAFDKALSLVVNENAHVWIGLREHWVSVGGSLNNWENLHLPQGLLCVYFIQSRRKWFRTQCAMPYHFVCKTVGKVSESYCTN